MCLVVFNAVYFSTLAFLSLLANEPGLPIVVEPIVVEPRLGASLVIPARDKSAKTSNASLDTVVFNEAPNEKECPANTSHAVSQDNAPVLVASLTDVSEKALFEESLSLTETDGPQTSQVAVEARTNMNTYTTPSVLPQKDPPIPPPQDDSPTDPSVIENSIFFQIYYTFQHFCLCRQGEDQP